ncbi:MAG: 23S rRNA (uracil(1939)-C(5))-methyltransferase RlmD [Coriobacteriia bacterium]|nr:23S rRNA (uracil(1939)-C(5))-methyltransferase RlmD [Coriobacteriia bacterium]
MDQQSNVAMRTCAVDRLCGGCANSAVPYDRQLAAKDRAMSELFAQVRGNAELRPIMGMDDPYYYRNKVASPFASGKKLPGKGKPQKGEKPGRNGKAKGGVKRTSRGLDRDVLTGMYQVGTHRLVPTDECLIENRNAKRVVLAIRQIMMRHGIQPYDEDKGTGFIRHVVVRVGHESGEMLVTVVTNEREFPASKQFCRELVKRCPYVTTVVQNVNMRKTNVILGQEERTLYGPGFILDTLCGLSFRISSQSFYQVNAVQTEVLYTAAIDLAGLTGNETVIDAYCGTGTIGLVAASRGAKRVIGVESVASAVRDARQNARHNGVDNAQFVTADAAQLMRALAGQQTLEAAVMKDIAQDVPVPEQTVLLMDPPRAGSSPEFLEAASAFGPRKIVYISCNPTTQERDVKYLINCGYRLQVIQPVDMFPHTDHVECICLLQRAETSHEKETA